MFSFLKKKVEIKSPIRGELISLEKVSDPVFSEGMMGPGFAIIPDTDELYSPVIGKVKSIFPTKHAIGIESRDGREILIHLGIDTVELDGQGFTLFVNEEDQLDYQTKLVKIDREYLKVQEKEDTVIILFPEEKQKINVKEKNVTTHEVIEIL